MARSPSPPGAARGLHKLSSSGVDSRGLGELLLLRVNMASRFCIWASTICAWAPPRPSVLPPTAILGAWFPVARRPTLARPRGLAPRIEPAGRRGARWRPRPEQGSPRQRPLPLRHARLLVVEVIHVLLQSILTPAKREPRVPDQLGDPRTTRRSCPCLLFVFGGSVACLRVGSPASLGFQPARRDI